MLAYLNAAGEYKIAQDSELSSLVNQGFSPVDLFDGDGIAALVTQAVQPVPKAPSMVFFDASLSMPSGVTTTALGKVSFVTTSTAGAATTQAYSFSSVFLTPPLVFVSVMGDNNEAEEVRASVKNVTEGGCTVCVTRVSGHNNGATESVVVAVMAVGVVYALPL